MSAITAFERAIAESWPRSQRERVHVIVAVSGGADSVALLRALHAQRNASAEPAGELIVAHVNHGLREAAAADAAFVEQLAAELGVRAIVRSVDTRSRAGQAGDGIESAARELRYDALRGIAHEVGARYVATAHTADDQAETVLHRVVRGTSVAGLAGMRRTRPLSDSVTLIRPLLGIRRAEVEAYLAELAQGYRSDATNLDRQFTRNRFRLDLLPQLAADFNPAVVEALLRLGESAAEAQEALDYARQGLARSAVISSQADRIEIDCAAMATAPIYLRTLVIRREWALQNWPQQAMTREHWQRLADMTAVGYLQLGAVDFPSGVVAQKQAAGQLVLTRRAVG